MQLSSSLVLVFGLLLNSSLTSATAIEQIYRQESKRDACGNTPVFGDPCSTEGQILCGYYEINLVSQSLMLHLKAWN